MSNISIKRGSSGDSPLALEALDDFLSSDASPEGCMQLSDLDGFLTGIIVGPELIMPSEWLPVIWGEDHPDFESDEMAELILGTIMDRYNEIIQSLSADPPDIKPIFWETQDGIVFAGDWAEGFMDAMSLRAMEWVEMMDDEEAQLPLVPIIALVGDEDGNPILIGETEDQTQLNSDTAELIPSCVIEIDAFWKARRGSASDTAGTQH